MLLVDGLDESAYGVDPLDDRRALLGPGHHGDDAAHVAVFPGYDGGIVFERDAGEGALVVQ